MKFGRPDPTHTSSRESKSHLTAPPGTQHLRSTAFVALQGRVDFPTARPVGAGSGSSWTNSHSSSQSYMLKKFSFWRFTNGKCPAALSQLSTFLLYHPLLFLQLSASFPTAVLTVSPLCTNWISKAFHSAKYSLIRTHPSRCPCSIAHWWWLLTRAGACGMRDIRLLS